MGFGDSVYWGVDSGVGAGVDSADGIKFGIDDGSNLGYSDYSFNGLNYEKSLCSLIDQ